MSDNTNPQDFGILGDTGGFGTEGTLNASNSEDTIKFTLPSTEDLLSSNKVVLDKVDIVGYDFTVGFDNLDESVNLSLGTDSSPDGSFDQDNEILGRQFLVEPDSDNFAFVSYSDLDPNPSIPADLLQENQPLFLDIESTSSNTNNYELTFSSSPIYKGELTGEDDSYCCDGTHKDKYYYDRLDELSPNAISDVEEGDLIEATLFTKSFEPVLFLLNQDTGEVIDVEYESTEITLGADTYKSVDLSFEVPSNIDNYVLSVESASANEQGEYFLSTDVF
jgi:hypothetical protein